MKNKLKSVMTAIGFLILVSLPQMVKAQDPDVQKCLTQLRQNWFPHMITQFRGQTRHETNCSVRFDLTTKSFNVLASGNPLQVEFTLGDVPDTEQTIESCRVDKEKIHLVFEEKPAEQYEKRERVQLTLLKRQGKGISMILSKREMKLLRPSQQSNLICHLN